MTTKHDRILEVGLELFANQGFEKTTTAQIAKKANVSEGLIFKYYKSKEGLLLQLCEQLNAKRDQIIGRLQDISSPKAQLQAMIAAPFHIPKAEHDFWRLQYRLKQNTRYRAFFEEKKEVNFLIQLFQDLGSENPEVEAKILYDILIGAFQQILYQEMNNKEEYLRLLERKYGCM